MRSNTDCSTFRPNKQFSHHFLLRQSVVHYTCRIMAASEESSRFIQHTKTWGNITWHYWVDSIDVTPANHVLNSFQYLHPLSAYKPTICQHTNLPSAMNSLQYLHPLSAYKPTICHEQPPIPPPTITIQTYHLPWTASNTSTHCL